VEVAEKLVMAHPEFGKDPEWLLYRCWDSSVMDQTDLFEQEMLLEQRGDMEQPAVEALTADNLKAFQLEKHEVPDMSSKEESKKETKEKDKDKDTDKKDKDKKEKEKRRRRRKRNAAKPTKLKLLSKPVSAVVGTGAWSRLVGRSNLQTLLAHLTSCRP
jgi:hypothetical protein